MGKLNLEGGWARLQTNKCSNFKEFLRVHPVLVWSSQHGAHHMAPGYGACARCSSPEELWNILQQENDNLENMGEKTEQEA